MVPVGLIVLNIQAPIVPSPQFSVEGPSLFRAILVNDLEQAKHALKIGAPPNTRYKHGNTALHFGRFYIQKKLRTFN